MLYALRNILCVWEGGDIRCCLHSNRRTCAAASKGCLTNIVSKVSGSIRYSIIIVYDDVMIWKRVPNYKHFVREFHRWPVDSPLKGPIIWGSDIHFLCQPVHTAEQTFDRCIEMFWCAFQEYLLSLCFSCFIVFWYESIVPSSLPICFGDNSLAMSKPHDCLLFCWRNRKLCG